MQRPTHRRDALRERVIAGRLRQQTRRRRAAAARRGGRRLVAVAAGLGTVAALLTVTQLASSAWEETDRGLGANDCPEPTAGVAETTAAEELADRRVRQEEGATRHHGRHGTDHRAGGDDLRGGPAPESTGTPTASVGGPGGSPGAGGDCDGTGDGAGPGDGAGDGEGAGEGAGTGDGEGAGGPGSGGGSGGGDGDAAGGGGDGGGDGGGLDLLGRTCDDSDLPRHTGFQSEQARCVQTQAGEVSAAGNNPSLLITDFPTWVGVDEPFALTVSTRNLLRDRFLGAADGGYYLESSFLTEDGIQRGHFHLGCLRLGDGRVAPDPATTLDPQFFTAVEDGGGGAGVDVVTVEVPGLPEPGLYRCMAWAGDPSHRVPMMSFARQQIAVDAVRITVTDGAVPPGPGA